MKSFDEIVSDHLKIITTGKQQQLEMLLKEIITYKYETFSQLKGAIENHLDLIKSKK